MAQQKATGVAVYQPRKASSNMDFTAIEFRLNDNGSADDFIDALAENMYVVSHLDIRQSIHGGVERIKFKYEGRKYTVRPGDLVMFRNFHDGDPIEVEIMPQHLYRRFFQQVAADQSNLNPVSI